MPKRKQEIEYINWKIKKLKKKLKKRSRQDASLVVSSSRSASEHDDEPDQVEMLLESPRDMQPEEVLSLNEPAEVEPQPVTTEVVPQPNLSPNNNLEVDTAIDDNERNPQTLPPEDLDPEVLDILGSDPSMVAKQGTEIHKELATRIQHIATHGLNKETVKELNENYLIPANSTLIGAPLLNAEIKAAISEHILKRDKGIENRQNQLAKAISGLTRVLTKELEKKNQDKEHLKQLMDVCRILCNMQHTDSVTRRNFAIFALKKDIKDHLINTVIDKYLFGANLAETLKSAKAVTKSSIEIKTKMQPNPKTFPPSNNLNWRSPAPAQHKQQRVQRGRDAAPPSAPGPSTRYNRNTRQGSSSKPSRQQPKPSRRR